MAMVYSLTCVASYTKKGGKETELNIPLCQNFWNKCGFELLLDTDLALKAV